MKQINQNIEETLRSLLEKFAKIEKADEFIPILEDSFKEVSFEIDQKYIILINSLWDKNIYAQFRARAPVIKHVIFLLKS